MTGKPLGGTAFLGAQLWLRTLCVLQMHKVKASSFRHLHQVAQCSLGTLSQVQRVPAP